METVGLKAVLDGVPQYVSGAQKTVSANAQLGRSVDDVASKSPKLNALGSAFSKVGSIASGFVIGEGILKAPGLLIESANAAAEDAASTAKLQRAIENTGHSYDEYAVRVKDSIDLAQKRGFTDDQARDSLSILTAQTDSAGEALKRFSLAQDLARGTGLDVVSASRLLGKVTDENVNVLKRYGISVEKGATETDLLNAVQRKFSGQADTFANSAAGQAAAVKIAFHELSESVGYIILPLMGALARVLNVAVIPAFNKVVTIIGPQLQAQGRKLSAVFKASGIVEFVKGLNEGLGPLGDYLKEVARTGDLFNGFLDGLTQRQLTVGIVLGSGILILKEVAHQLGVIVKVGADVLGFIGQLTAKLISFLPQGEHTNSVLGKIAGNESGIKLIAAAITGFIAVLATAQVLGFAASVAGLATNILGFPVRTLEGAIGTITNFGRSAKTAADDAVDAAKRVEGVAGQGAGQCMDKTVTCTEKIVTEAQPPAAKAASQQAYNNYLKGLGVSGGESLASGVGLGVGAKIGPIILTAIGEAFAGVTAAGLAIAAAVIAAALLAALGIYLDYKKNGLKKLLLDFLNPAGLFGPLFAVIGDAIAAGIKKYVLPKFVEGFKKVPQALAFLAGAVAAATLVYFVGIPALIIKLISEGLRKGVPLVVSAAKDIGSALLDGLDDLKRDVPGLFVDTFRAAVKGIPTLLHAIPGFVQDVLDDIFAILKQLPTEVGREFGSIPDIVQTALGLVSTIATGIFNGILDLIRTLGLDTAVHYLMDGVVGAFEDGFATVDKATGGTLSGLYDTFSGWGSRIVALFGVIVGGISAAFSGIDSGVTTAFNGVEQAIIGAIANIASAVAAVLKKVDDGLDALAAVHIPGVADAQKLLDGLIGSLTGIGGSRGGGPAPGQSQTAPGLPASFLHLASGTAGLAFPSMAVLGEHGRELALLPAGTAVVPANQTRSILSALSGMVPGRGAAGGTSVGISIPINITSGNDWTEIRRQVHAEIDRVFSSSRSRNTRAGAPVGSGIG